MNILKIIEQNPLDVNSCGVGTEMELKLSVVTSEGYEWFTSLVIPQDGVDKVVHYFRK